MDQSPVCMDRVQKICVAALEGDVATFRHLLQEDPLLLHRMDCEPDASGHRHPLHISALRGDAIFLRELLRRRPELAGARDESGSYPIHLAAAGGHSGVVAEILDIGNPGYWRVLDKDGRTPLHLAAANGRVEVVRQLLGVDASLAGVVSGRGESALQMCLLSNQVEAAQALMDSDEDLVQIRDSAGNTLLHMAAATKQIQMIKLILDKKQLDVNAKNEWNCTALDMSGDLKISHLLSTAGCKTKKQNAGPTTPVSLLHLWKKWVNPWNWFERKEKDDHWYRDKYNTLLVVATLIATVTFASGLNPPGGVWQNDNRFGSANAPSPPPFSPMTMLNGHKLPGEPGTAVLDGEKLFMRFMYFDLAGLVSSLFSILFLVSGLPLHNFVTRWILTISIWVAVTSMAMAFAYGTRAIVVSDWITRKLVKFFIGWLVLTALLIFGHSIAATLRLVYIGMKMKHFILRLKRMKPSWSNTKPLLRRSENDGQIP